MGLVFIRSKKRVDLCSPENFSQQKESTSTDLHVSNGSGPISVRYASLAAAAALW